MADDKAESPSTRAMTILQERLASDEALDESVKDAVLEDLSGENPAGLERLKKLLLEGGQSDEAGKPESA